MTPQNPPLPSQENPDAEARLMQADEHHREIAGQLDTLIQQGADQNTEPVLEASLQKLDDIAKNTEPKEVQKMELVEPTDDEGALQRTFWKMLRGQKGEKGDKGDKGEKGDTGADSTVPGPTGPQGEVGLQGAEGERGAEGAPGRDGRDGRDGDEGPMGQAGPRGPRGPRGADGIQTGKEIVEKLAGLEGADRLSFDSLKDTPEYLRRPASRDYDFIELKDTPKTYSGQAGKFVKVKTNETGLEFGAGGGGGSGVSFICAEQSGLLPAGETVYLGRGQAFEAEYPLFVAREACEITELMVMNIVGNGAAHTDTYKVFKNGVATTMVLAVTNSSARGINATTSNPVTLSVGDSIAIQVVCDAATIAANTLVQLTVTPS